MASVTAHRPSISIAGPAVLWSLHFVFVYVFVSLGCLWSWDGRELLGVGVIEWGVATATVVIGAIIATMGLRQWWQARPPRSDRLPDTPRFVARVGVLSSALFLAATLFVGLLTLPRPACY